MSFTIGTRHPALCSDGVIRSALVVNYADTFYTVPARVTVRGKTVTGFIFLHGMGKAEETRFSADQWRKNATALPKWEK